MTGVEQAEQAAQADRAEQPTQPTDERVGSVVAERYLVERLIGRGGMATVYEAADQQLPRRVALKIFKPELADGDDMSRHKAEVAMLASLNHPGLVTLFDASTTEDGGAVLILELVQGDDLRQTMDDGPLPGEEVAVIGAAVADALSYSHDRGIVHRDVKPGNILVPSHDGTDTAPRAKLADFGIARLVDETRVTATGAVLGTAHYLSPEQAVGGEVGPASDVYSLGLVLLEALTGERAFPGTGVESAAARLARDPFLPPDMSPEWAGLIRSMTAREPDDRPTAREGAERLRAIASIPAFRPADDSLEATRVLPALPTEATEVMGAGGAADAVGSPAAPGVPTSAPRSPVDEPTAAMTATGATAGNGARDAAADIPARRSGGIGARLELLKKRPLAVAATVAAAIVLLIVGFGASTALAGLVAAEAPPATPDYPVVEGVLGEHLDQLQRSVAP
ncbi:MAG: serine/threonine-protein kinase [Actinomycetes bacterium]